MATALRLLDPGPAGDRIVSQLLWGHAERGKPLASPTPVGSVAPSLPPTPDGLGVPSGSALRSPPSSATAAARTTGADVAAGSALTSPARPSKPVAGRGLSPSLALVAVDTATAGGDDGFSAPARPATTPQSLSAAISERGKELYAFELRRAAAAAAAASPPLAQASELQTSTPEASPLGDIPDLALELLGPIEAPWRPPEGSAYNYHTFRPGPVVTLAQRFAPDSPAAAEPPPPASARELRRARIRELEEGLHAHDTWRARGIARGTGLPRGEDGEPVLPVPPPPPKGPSRVDGHKWPHLVAFQRTAKERLRDRVLGAQVLGGEISDRPPSPATLERAARAFGDAPASSPASPARSVPGGRPAAALVLRGTADLVAEAEAMLRSPRTAGPSDDDWRRLSTQIGGRVYELEVAEVLRMVLTLSAASRGGAVRAEPNRRELLRTADQLLQSLTSRLRSEPLDMLAQVLETMVEARVGNQGYFDMVMALILAQHHRDCRALTPRLALRFATALGRISKPGGPRLRPKGVGSASTPVNLRCMDAIQERVLSGLGQCTGEDLSGLDDYYLTHICSDRAAHAIATRVAELRIGLRDATKGRLEAMIELEKAIARELPEHFRFGLSRTARDYYEQVRILGLKETAPWTIDPAAAARARLQAMRAEAY